MTHRKMAIVNPLIRFQWLEHLSFELLVGQIATHFASGLFGVFVASMYYVRPWPAAALALQRPTVVYAIPEDRIDSGNMVPGDSAHLVGTGNNECLISTKALRILALEPSVLLSVHQDGLRDTGVDRWLSDDSSRARLSRKKSHRCQTPGGGVVVERL